MARIPDKLGVRSLVVVALATLAMLGAWEGYLRGADLGEYPDQTVPNALDHVRRAADDDDRRVFVFGSSRTQLGISPAILGEQLGRGWEVRHAGMPFGNGPRQLHACSEWFEEGDIVVVECLPIAAYTNLRNPYETEFERRVQDPGLNRIERELTSRIRQEFYFARGRVTPSDELRMAARGVLGMEQPQAQEPLFANAVVLHDDGWIEYTSDFKKELTAGLVEFLLKTVPDDPEDIMNGVMRRLRSDVQRLQSRGVQVVFLRMPSDGEYAATEEQLFPRAQFWSQLEHAFPEHCWHFADFEVTRNLQTYDNTHMTGKSARIYSRWLGARLRKLAETENR